MPNIKTNQLITLNGQKLSDHNRAQLDQSYIEVAGSDRMSDGTLRRYIVSRKRTFSTSWTDLPDHNNDPGALMTVDGGLPVQGLKSLYENTTGPLVMVLRDGRGDEQTLQVFITELTTNLKKRGRVDLYDVSITIEEV